MRRRSEIGPVTACIDLPMPDLESLFDRHEKAVLAFSGGKDSLVCLDICRAYRDQLTVVWVNTGAMFPHMRDFVYRQRTCQAAPRLVD